MRFSTLVSAAAFFELSIAGYVLEDDYMTDFYSNFNFFTGPDPTQGFVKFVDEATARKSNLINASMTTAAQFGVDVTNKTPDGRPSMRIESKKKYNNGLIVLDVAHMPFGCGTWPAFWTLGPNWPKGGEIDIIEGVNEYTNNSMTLHTGPGCQIGSDTTAFTGSVTTGNCDVNAKGQSKNAGCSIENKSKQSYGAGLNQNGGGVYAMQWNADAISVYFFPRDNIPADVLGDCPNPTTWGKPAAKFVGGCDIEESFAEQQIIIDTTFCGAWAGSEWEDSSCGKKAKTCEEYVRDNPEAFTEAYWEINALKVYQDDGKPPAAPSVPAVPPKSSAISVAPSVSAVLPKSSAIPVPAPPAATISGGYSGIAPPVSSQAVPAVPSSKSILEVPAKPTPAPAVPLPSSIVAAPEVPSAVPEIPSQPTASPVVPVLSSAAAGPSEPPAVPLPSSAAGYPELPSVPTATPVVPIPSSAAAGPSQPPAAPVAPLPSSGAPVPNQPSPSPAKPSKPAAAQPNEPAPTGANGLPGWRWPSAGDAPASGAPAATTTAASAPAPSEAPAQNTTGDLTPPTPQQNNVTPSQAHALPAQPAAPSAVVPVAPVAPVEPVHTVYETVYVTVPAQAAATPAPDAKKARMARHVREHRRKWTQHNARL